MRAYLGITDWDWFRLLAGQVGLEELNFWQPSPRRFGALSPGEPFLFKLHRSAANGRDVVAGGGFFAYWTTLPAAIAWDAFGIANGARSLDEMHRRLTHYRRADPFGPVDYSIGCIMLSQPFFLPPEEWIEVPGWPGSVQVGKGYDTADSVVGRSIWNQVEMRLRARNMLPQAEPSVVREGERFREVVVQQRLGQGTFRIMVTDAYQRACAVTRERALPVLQASHIVPFAQGGEHSLGNGLLFRSDLHLLFDHGYVTVTPEYRLEVSERLKTEYNNGEVYLAMRGHEIWVPERISARPDPEALTWHNEHRFVA